MSYYFETYGYVEENGLQVPKPCGFSNTFFKDMTWKKVRVNDRDINCRNCGRRILNGSLGFGGSWSKLCIPCGKKFINGMVDYLKRAQVYFNTMETYVDEISKAVKEIKENDKKD